MPIVIPPKTMRMSSVSTMSKLYEFALGVGYCALKITPTTRCEPAFQSLKPPTQKTDWPRTPIFGADISDRVALCQLVVSLGLKPHAYRLFRFVATCGSGEIVLAKC